MRRKLIAVLGASVAILCVAAASVVLLWPERFPVPAIPIPAIEDLLPDLGGSAALDAAPPQTAEPVPPVSQDAVEEAARAPAPAAEPAAQPSFDVVRIEPTGEGVIAGRAAPGWTVSVESGGTKLAEVAADEQGEWTVVLDKPLSAGDHSLSLKAISPDGTQALSSTQSVGAAIVAKQPPSDAIAMTPDAAATPARAVTPGGVPPSGAPPGDASPLAQTAAVEAGREAAPVPPALAPQDKPGVYTILPGDTLWDIAQRYLGAGWRYPAIHQGNRNIIRNPNLIFPEQKMTIPEPSDPDSAQVR